jgi:acetylornithine/succinyldiaminopimelate/putrescine aminotransferase
MNEKASNLYVQGVYGNTMTTNPRALEVACTVLDSITPALRQNIRDRGTEIVAKLIALGDEFPGAITTVQGTGLLLAAELHPTKLPVTGFGNVEEWCRKHGIGVIHGGKNALRYTPHFNITSAEIDLIVDNLRQALTHFWK